MPDLIAEGGGSIRSFVRVDDPPGADTFQITVSREQAGLMGAVEVEALYEWPTIRPKVIRR